MAARAHRRAVAAGACLLLLVLSIVPPTSAETSSGGPAWLIEGTVVAFTPYVRDPDGVTVDVPRLRYVVLNVSEDTAVVALEGAGHPRYPPGDYTVALASRMVVAAPDPVHVGEAFDLWVPDPATLAKGDTVAIYDREYEVTSVAEDDDGGGVHLRWDDVLIDEDGAAHPRSDTRIYDRLDVPNRAWAGALSSSFSDDADGSSWNLVRASLAPGGVAVEYQYDGDLPRWVAEGVRVTWLVEEFDPDGVLLLEGVWRFTVLEVTTERVTYRIDTDLPAHAGVQGTRVVRVEDRTHEAGAGMGPAGGTTSLWVPPLTLGDPVRVFDLNATVVDELFFEVPEVIVQATEDLTVGSGEVLHILTARYRQDTGALLSATSSFEGLGERRFTAVPNEEYPAEAPPPGWVEEGTVLRYHDDIVAHDTKIRKRTETRYEVLEATPERIRIEMRDSAGNRERWTIDPATRTVEEATVDANWTGARHPLWVPSLGRGQHVRIEHRLSVVTERLSDDPGIPLSGHREWTEFGAVWHLPTIRFYDSDDRVLVGWWSTIPTRADIYRELVAFYVPSREADVTAGVLTPVLLIGLGTVLYRDRRRRAAGGGLADLWRVRPTLVRCPACQGRPIGGRSRCDACGGLLEHRISPGLRWARWLMTGTTTVLWAAFLAGPVEVTAAVRLLVLALPAATITLWVLTDRYHTYRTCGRVLVALTLVPAALTVLLGGLEHADAGLYDVAFEVLEGPTAAAVGASLGAAVAFWTAPGTTDEATSNLVTTTFVAAPVAWFVLLSDLLVLFLAAAAAASLAWSLLGYPLARATLLRFLTRSETRLVRIGDTGPPELPLEARHLLRLASVPLLFAYAVAAWTDPFVAGTEGLERALLVARAALIVLGVGTVLVVPGTWLFEAARLKAYDPRTGLTRRFGLPGLVGEFLGLGAFLGLLNGAFGGGGAVTAPGIFEGFLTALMTIWFLLPAALVPTYLYVRFRAARDLGRLDRTIGYDVIDHLDEAHREVDA